MKPEDSIRVRLAVVRNVEFEDNRAAVPILDGKADGLTIMFTLHLAQIPVVTSLALAKSMARMAPNLTDRATSPKLDSRVVIVAFGGDVLACELESSNGESELLRRKTSLNRAEQQTDSDASKSNTTVERVPSSDL